MKRLLTIFLSALMAVSLKAQTEEHEPNMLRYHMTDGTTFDVKISSLDRLQKVGNKGWNNVFNDGSANRAVLFSNVEYIEFFYDENVTPDPPNNNVNKNTNPRAMLLEYPRLREGNMDILSIHSTKDYGITFGLEYDCNKRLARWVTYQMHKGNSYKNVTRTNAWGDDPNIPYQYRTSSADFTSNFSRGHLCPSSDRLCSREQNAHTFYYSNMMPQYQNHNGGLWQSMEQQVTNKWNTDNFRDTLYVVKAATIYDQLTTTGTGLTVPRYFYMAVLCVKNGSYKAIGFWSLHENVSRTKEDLKKYAISIDELEERTGIDFFCNLPDDIEEEAEREVNTSDWNL
ncbi:MAG: DNA/RNA non-specific endonuclease [Prevotella sp.]|nr:DNA/RNA non-specific endonuclease [Prevotella sp.]